MDTDPFDIGTCQTLVIVGRQRPLDGGDHLRNCPWVHTSSPNRWLRADSITIRQSPQTFGPRVGVRWIELIASFGRITYEMQSHGEITFDDHTRSPLAVLAGEFYVTSCVVV